MIEKLTTLALIGVCAFPVGAIAQTAWPDKPVRIVVPYAPGGTTDYAARQIAAKLSEQTKKTFYVENKPGASGTIGTSFVAKASPDGYTLLANDTTYSVLPSLFARLPWDYDNDIVPVTTIAQTPVVLIVGASSPYKTLSDLIGHAQKNPDKLNFGSGGSGSSTHLAAEVFTKEAKASITHVPYKGAGEAMLGLISNQVDLLVTASPTAVPQVKGGKVRALAVTGEQRLSSLPDVPTFKEAGLPSYGVNNWFGLATPKGTPKDVIAKLHGLVGKALEEKSLRDQFAQQGAQPGGIPPEQFSELIRRDAAMWRAAAKDAKIKPE
jgi:tripartite-type tricarboxylate transporter receptor subunit TctC